MRQDYKSQNHDSSTKMKNIRTNSTAKKPLEPEEAWFSENKLRTKLAIPAINAVIDFIKKYNQSYH